MYFRVENEYTVMKCSQINVQTSDKLSILRRSASATILFSVKPPTTSLNTINSVLFDTEWQ